MRQKTWRGRRISWSHPNGYPRVRWHGHPQASSNGMVYIHRIVGSEIAGRVLSSKDHVHHRDGDVTNWRVSNLEILSSSSHAIEHAKSRSAPVTLLSCSNCGLLFERQTRLVKFKRASGQVKFYCDRSCMWSAYHARNRGA